MKASYNFNIISMDNAKRCGAKIDSYFIYFIPNVMWNRNAFSFVNNGWDVDPIIYITKIYIKLYVYTQENATRWLEKDCHVSSGEVLSEVETLMLI